MVYTVFIMVKCRRCSWCFKEIDDDFLINDEGDCIHEECYRIHEECYREYDKIMEENKEEVVH